jgi:hypothetical protein
MDSEFIVQHAIDVLGPLFFEMIRVIGLCRLSRTCRRFRYLQQQREALLGAIVGSTNGRVDLEARLALFGMMPRAMVHGSRASTALLRVARAYERNVIANRRFLYPQFYAKTYYGGILGSSDITIRRRVWREIAAILCEMLENGVDVGCEPWTRVNFQRRRNNARHYHQIPPD